MHLIIVLRIKNAIKNTCTFQLFTELSQVNIQSSCDKYIHLIEFMELRIGINNRWKSIGYQYSAIIRAVFSVFCCGGIAAHGSPLWNQGHGQG